jgi:hypothetical protein
MIRRNFVLIGKNSLAEFGIIDMIARTCSAWFALAGWVRKIEKLELGSGVDLKCSRDYRVLGVAG